MEGLYTIALALVSAAIGYRIGSHSRETEPDLPHVEDDSSVIDQELGGLPDGDLSAVHAEFFEPCKLVLIVRTDITLSTGNVSTQCANATLACYKVLSKANIKLTSHWERTGQAKIALKCKSEKQLRELEAIAKSLNLCARLVKDIQLTGSKGENTVLAIGPAPISLVNEVTGKLRLL